MQNPYLDYIYSSIKIDEWKAEGLTDQQIEERFLKEGILAAFGSSPDINAIEYQIRYDGLSLDDGLMLASAAVFGKFTDKTAGAANKGKTPGSDHKLSSGQTVSDFEMSLVRLSSGERVDRVKENIIPLAKENGWVKDNKISTMNNRDVYKGKDGYLYAVDSQHGRVEKINQFQGEWFLDYQHSGHIRILLILWLLIFLRVMDWLSHQGIKLD